MCPSLTGTTGSYPGCLVSQPSRLLTTSEPHQGAGGREMPPCLCVSAARVRGRAGGTPGLTLSWCLALLVPRGACSLSYVDLLVSLPCAGALHKSHALVMGVSRHCTCVSAQRWGMPGPAWSHKGPY